MDIFIISYNMFYVCNLHLYSELQLTNICGAVKKENIAPLNVMKVESSKTLLLLTLPHMLLM